MTTGRRTWRRLFDTGERVVGEPLEALARRRDFAYALALAARTRRALEQNQETMLRWWLHRWGLPARADIADVAASVARLERRLQQLSHQLEEMQDEHRDARP